MFFSFIFLRHQIAAYSLFLLFPSLVSLPLSFLQYRVLDDRSYARYDTFIWPSLFLLYVVCYFLPSLYVTLLHFSHDRSKLYSPSFSYTSFRNFPGISNLLSEASKFQHHTRLCSKPSTTHNSKTRFTKCFIFRPNFVIRLFFCTKVVVFIAFYFVYN